MKMVQRFFVCFVLGISGVGQLIAAIPNDLLASYHFVGSVDLAKNTNATKLKQVVALPETAQFRDDVLQKLSGASLKFLGANSGNSNQVALARSLFDDLLRAESQAELRSGTDSGAELVLAARLSDERSRLWETNLLQLAKTSKPQPAKIDDAGGWQVKCGSNFLKFFRVEKWTVLVLGQEHSTAPADFLKRLRKQPADSGDSEWLEAEIDWPRLTPWLSLKSPLKLARTELRIIGQGENLRTTVRAIYPEKIDWKSQAWRIPTGLIRDPLISFSAGQNLASFLKPTFVPPQLSFNPLTNQIYFWAQADMPFQSYFAAPVKDSTNTMKQLAPQIAVAFNDDLKRRDGGELKMASNRVDLFWQGLPPFVIPFLRPAKTDNMEVLFGGLFLPPMNTNLPPKELLAQISGRNDLVYYDWEITQQRLVQWRNISQILPFFPKEPFTARDGKKRLIAAKMPEKKWLEAVGPLLGNTITEVTFKSPSELNILRKSHLGLNSVELIFLSHWLADPKFPSLKNSASLPIAEPAADRPRRGRPPRP